MKPKNHSYSYLKCIWLKAMVGRHPTSLITVQDGATTGEIAKIFPHTRHHFFMAYIRMQQRI